MICEVCGLRSKICVRHHITSKSLGGSNQKNNLTILCSNCHAEVHHGNIVLEGKFMSTAGFKLIWRYPNDMPVTGHKPDTYIYGRKQSNEDTFI